MKFCVLFILNLWYHNQTNKDQEVILMADIYQEIKELKEKIEFCSYAMKYGKMLDMSSDQTVKAFKVKGELEDELRFMELKNKNKG